LSTPLNRGKVIAGNAGEQERIDKARERRKRLKIVEEELARLEQAYGEG